LRGRRSSFQSGFTLWYHDATTARGAVVAQIHCDIDDIIKLDHSELSFDDRVPDVRRITIAASVPSAKILSAVANHHCLTVTVIDSGRTIEVAFTPAPTVGPGIKLGVKITTTAAAESMIMIPVTIGHVGL
jgi:hypothetical protein